VSRICGSNVVSRIYSRLSALWTLDGSAENRALYGWGYRRLALGHLITSISRLIEAAFANLDRTES